MKLSCFASGLPVAMVLGVTGVTWGQGSPPPGGAASPEPVFEEISMMRDSFMPFDDLVNRGDGAFYCMALWWVGGEGSAILRLVPGEGPEVLHQFSTKLDPKSAVDGYDPITGVVLGADGALYGACRSGGANGYGTIYRLSADGVFSVVCDLDESMTSGMRLAASPDGMIYGAMTAGGPNGGGFLFSLNPNDGALTTLCAFQEMPSERPPEGTQTPFSCPTELAVGADGKVYGRFEYGGTMSAGSHRRSFGGLFRYDSPGAFTVLHEEVPVGGTGYLRELVPTEDGFLAAGRTMMHHLGFDGDFTIHKDLYPMAWGPKKPVYVSGNVYGLIGEFTTEAPLLYRYGPGVEAERIHDFSADYDSRFISLMAANDGMLYGVATLPEGYVSQGKRGTRSVGTRVFRMKPNDEPANYVPFANPDAAWLPAKATKDGEREVIVDVLKNDRDVDGDALTLTGLGTWEGEGSAEIITTPKGKQRIRVVTAESDPKSRLLTYQVSDGRGGVATGNLAVQSQAVGTFRGEATIEGGSVATVTVVLGKNHTLKATVVLDGVTYSGQGLLDVDDTTDVSLRSKGGGQGANLHLALSRGSDRKVKATVVESGGVRTGDCAPVVK